MRECGANLEPSPPELPMFKPESGKKGNVGQYRANWACTGVLIEAVVVVNEGQPLQLVSEPLAASWFFFECVALVSVHVPSRH